MREMEIVRVRKSFIEESQESDFRKGEAAIRDAVLFSAFLSR